MKNKSTDKSLEIPTTNPFLVWLATASLVGGDVKYYYCAMLQLEKGALFLVEFFYDPTATSRGGGRPTMDGANPFFFPRGVRHPKCDLAHLAVTGPCRIVGTADSCRETFTSSVVNLE